jgi:aromatic-L-amino-acid decarboxylase
MSWQAADMPEQSGRLAVVTGANSGLGLITAQELARRGASVVMACRNLDKGERAMAEIRRRVPAARLQLEGLDLGELASVRAFAERTAAEHERVDLLVNNAGVMAPPRRSTADGFESQLGINHLGHFALTGRLLEALHRASAPRVVTLSSIAHRLGRIDFDDLQRERRYNNWLAYGQSKLANLMFALELARRAAAADSPLRSLAAHPGYAATNLQTSGPAARYEKLLGMIGNRLIAQSAEQGALPVLYAATAELPSGTFTGPGSPGEVRGAPRVVAGAARAYDEAPARALWALSEELTGVAYAALAWAADYLEGVADRPVLARVRPGELRARLPPRAPAAPEPFAAVLRDLDELLAPALTHWQHPRFFAYFATSAAEPAILAELLAATLNSVAILWRTAPAATELEAVVLAWVADLLGLPPGWHGHIEDGASTSTLAAIIAARTATGRELVVCSEQAHSSVAKAARMLGMELRTVPTDARHRLDPARLGALGRAACVVATVGTTASTSVDPVPAIAEACAEAGAWLHVDAAYAGTAMVCPEFRWAFAGVERADSLVVNAHKWMLAPMDCSLLWSRRPEALRDAFSLVPEYLRTPDAEDALSLSEYGPALGRRFRALKLWALLRCFGRSGLQEHVRRGVALAAQFARWVDAAPGWELAAPRPFSVVCFRLGGQDAEERNQALLEAVNASGEIFISHCVLGGRYTLRLAVGQQWTTAQDVARAWEVLRRGAALV